MDEYSEVLCLFGFPGNGFVYSCNPTWFILQAQAYFCYIYYPKHLFGTFHVSGIWFVVYSSWKYERSVALLLLCSTFLFLFFLLKGWSEKQFVNKVQAIYSIQCSLLLNHIPTVVTAAAQQTLYCQYQHKYQMDLLKTTCIRHTEAAFHVESHISGVNDLTVSHILKMFCVSWPPPPTSKKMLTSAAEETASKNRQQPDCFTFVCTYPSLACVDVDNCSVLGCYTRWSTTRSCRRRTERDRMWLEVGWR